VSGGFDIAADDGAQRDDGADGAVCSEDLCTEEGDLFQRTEEIECTFGGDPRGECRDLEVALCEDLVGREGCVEEFVEDLVERIVGDVVCDGGGHAGTIG
jgi:hypothetical protein